LKEGLKKPGGGSFGTVPVKERSAAWVGDGHTKDSATQTREHQKQWKKKRKGSLGMGTFTVVSDPPKTRTFSPENNKRILHGGTFN